MRMHGFQKLHKGVSIVLSVVCMMLCVCVAKADVQFTEAGVKNNEYLISITGNPAFYPYEYYDTLTGTYKGVFPELYEIIGQETGLRFQYINTGESDERLIDAKTASADIVSAYLFNEKEAANYGLKEAIPIIQYTVDGKPVSICIIFGKYTDQEIIDQVKTGAQSITKGKVVSLIGLTLSRSMAKSHKGLYYFAIALLVVAFIGIIFLIIYRLHKRQVEEALKKRSAYIDKLTRIGNTKYFQEQYEIMAANKYKAAYVMAYAGFDIARSNKQYGDEMSEKQLKYTAGILTSNKKDHDIVARVAGGAFGILHVCSTEAEARDWGQVLIDRLNVYNSQFGLNYSPQFRCGIYRIPVDRWDYKKSIKNAARCYEIAVQKNIDCFVYSAEMERKDRDNEILNHDAAEAIKNDQIKQYLQLIVDMDNTIRGAEGLARWEHPKMGLLRPSRFIQMMIDEGHIVELDMKMFEYSCQQMVEWQKQGKDYFISTNFTRVSLTSKDFVVRVTTIADRYEFDRSRLIVEITEDSLEGNREAAFANMRFLKQQGFKVALDDLGSGFTFFSDLKYYPLDMIKVDREMLLDAKDERGEKLMSGVIQVCKDMGLTVLCEGVENNEQYKMVKKMGCELIQGYYFYKEMSREEAKEIM